MRSLFGELEGAIAVQEGKEVRSLSYMGNLLTRKVSLFTEIIDPTSKSS
jgi:hypothetical protein